MSIPVITNPGLIRIDEAIIRPFGLFTVFAGFVGFGVDVLSIMLLFDWFGVLEGCQYRWCQGDGSVDTF